jgi:hypothetical protein
MVYEKETRRSDMYMNAVVMRKASRSGSPVQGSATGGRHGKNFIFFSRSEIKISLLQNFLNYSDCVITCLIDAKRSDGRRN